MSRVHAVLTIALVGALCGAMVMLTLASASNTSGKQERAVAQACGVVGCSYAVQGNYPFEPAFACVCRTERGE